MVSKTSAQRSVEPGILGDLSGYNGIFFKNNPQPMWIYDLETLKFLEVNHAAEIQYGYSEAEFKGMTIADIRPSEDLARLMDNVSQDRPAFSDSGQWRHLRKDGSLIDVDIHSHTLVYNHRDAVFVVAMDVTDRVNSEKALRESENRYRRISELMSDYAYAFRILDDLSMATDWVVGGFERITGYTHEEIDALGGWPILIFPDDMPVAQDRARRLLAGEQDVSEFRIVRKDGSVRFLRDHGRPIWSAEKERVIFIYGAAQDITEEKRREKVLQESEGALRKAQQVAHVGSWAWHLQDNQLEWSDEMYHIFGIDRSSFTGFLPDVISLAIHPDDRLMVEKANLHVLQHREPFPLEYRVIWPDGRVRHVWGEAGELTLDREGKPLLLIGIVQDITDRKLGEEALRESEERYREIFNGVQDAILVESSDGGILAVNDRACEMYGYSREEFILKKVADLVPEGQRVLLTSNDEVTPSPVETINLRANGECFPIEISGRVQSIDGEKFLMVIVREITERKKAEREIQRYTEQLRVAGEMGRLLASSLQLDVIYEQLGLTVRQLLPDIATIYISRYDSRTSLTSAVYGEQDGERINVSELQAIQLSPQGLGAQSEVIRNRQPMIVGDLQGKLAKSNVVRVGTEGQYTQSALYVPVTAHDQALGVVQVQSYKPDRFTKTDAEILTLVANTAAVAIQNAELFEAMQTELKRRMQAEERIRQQLAQLSALREIDQAITSLPESENSLDVLLSKAISLLSVDAAMVLKLNPENNTLEFAAGTGFQVVDISNASISLGESYSGEAVQERREDLEPPVPEGLRG